MIEAGAQPSSGLRNVTISDEIAVYGGAFTLQGTVPNPGVAFFVTGDIRTLSGSSG